MINKGRGRNLPVQWHCHGGSEQRRRHRGCRAERGNSTEAANEPIVGLGHGQWGLTAEEEVEAKAALRTVATEEQFKKFMDTFPEEPMEMQEAETVPMSKQKESKSHLRSGGYDDSVLEVQMIGTC